jgi:asparagine synthase (glutamine-hydrolysing)
MCGICGIVARKALPGDYLDRLRAVNALLSPRGPDGTGEYSDAYVALAMRRLSIIDLDHGWQPLYNEDRSLALIANGEIYNFVELRQDLLKAGHRFATGSDCETILHLYEQHGTECLKHMRGMFAFALWDTRRRRLMLGRDRMGEKPLYLYERDGELFFASELKAILAFGVIPFELDPMSIDRYFHYSYVPEPGTPIKGVRKLDAARFLTVDVDTWQVGESCYWRMEDALPVRGDPAEVIRAELDSVSKLVIRSDVPVGIALSGGMDSGAVAVLAARSYPGTMHAFTVGYPGRPPNDERADAKALADFLGMPFHEMELSTRDMVEVFPKLVYWRDDPIADISGYGYCAVMRSAREHSVPVILQGQGGDELFWGYPWAVQAVHESLDKYDLRRSRWLAWPRYLRIERPNGYNRWQWRSWIRNLGGLRPGWRRLLQHSRLPADRMIFYDTFVDFQMASEGARSLYTADFNARLGSADTDIPRGLPATRSDIDIHITRLACATYLRENGITQADRLSMASSVELRLPLVDHKLVEAVIGLRKARKDYRLPPKAWLREALKEVVPEWVMNRPKRGFNVPVYEWHDALFAAYGRPLENGVLVRNGILSPQSAQRLACGPFPAGSVVPLSFKALVLEMWCRAMNPAGR